MTTGNHAAYLEAMGISRWALRPELVPGPSEAARPVPEPALQPPEPAGQSPDPATIAAEPASSPAPGFPVSLISHGQSSWLWMLGNNAAAEQPMLRDLQRAAGEEGECTVVIPGNKGDSDLRELIRERLITRVVLLGADAACAELIDGASVNVITAPGLEALANDPSGKRALWQQLRELTGSGRS